jgi:hypothetical protein
MTQHCESCDFWRQRAEDAEAALIEALNNSGVCRCSECDPLSIKNINRELRAAIENLDSRLRAIPAPWRNKNNA